MAKRVKKLLKEMQETGQQVYGTKKTPFRTARNVLIDAATGGRKLKTNVALRAAQAAKRKAAELAAKRKAKAKAEAERATAPAGRSKPSSQGGPRMGSTAKAGAAPRPNRRKGKVTVEEVQKRAAGGMAKKKRLKPVEKKKTLVPSNVHPVKRAEKQLRDQMYKDRPPSADTRRMLEESTQDKINRANEEGVQESKTLPKTPKTPKTPKAGKKAKTRKASGPSMGSTAKAGAAAERGALAGRRKKGKVTVEEVQKRAKGGMVKKKTSVQKKPRGVGAATRGYGRALK